MGNEEPFLISVETWYAPRLKVLVSREEHDPRTGESRLELSNLQTEEPDASLFEVAADYRISVAAMPGPPVPRPAH